MSSPTNLQSSAFEPGEDSALALDAADPLRHCRDRFHIPKHRDGQPAVYFAGNSLGLQPKSAARLIEEELKDWADRGVEGHFEGTRPWYPYHELFRETGARLVGAKPGEVVIMNSLTVNLHLMMVSFYRPTKDRYKILIEDPCFPSDMYAVRSQLRYHGFDPADGLLQLKPRSGEHTLRMEDIESTLAREGERIALIMLGGVNFVTGQLFDMERITSLGHKYGCVVGFDLAHAAGNVPLRLHDWDVDFAVWCNYKYLNSGPGAVGGCFVHERHGRNAGLPRFAGWWGNDPATRFRMQLIPEFVPREGADGWQISNPPIFSMAPVKASYDIFDEAGMVALREKSLKLTAYLEFLLTGAAGISPRDGSRASAPVSDPTIARAEARGSASSAENRIEIITPSDPDQRGCQLSLMIRDDARGVLKSLQDEGVLCDFREPNIIRVAPVPLYNTFHDCWRFRQALQAAMDHQH
jgi:kynureninase